MPFTRGHALLVGVGTYQHTLRLNVPVTADDARAVAQVLGDPRFCGYPAAQVALLHDERATSVGILAALDQLALRTGLDDTVVLFYCGHGDFGDDGEYYLTSHETRIADKKVVAGTGLSQKTLLEKLRAIRARRMLLIFNACHSGAVAPTLGGADEPSPAGQNPPDETTAALLATGAGRIIITACRAAQLSYVGGGKLTLFTQALIGGLLGQGVDGRNGYISAFDLYTHVYNTVGQQVRQQFGAQQEPELTILKGVGPFAVALYRGAATLGAFDERAAPAPGTAVRPVEEQESQRAFERIMSVGQGVAVGRDVRDSTVVGRDQVSVQGSPGAIVGATGAVSQTNVNTGGGDYAGGNIDKRQGGVFIDGGAVYGPVTGSQAGGNISNLITGLLGNQAPQPAPLETAIAQARQAAEAARSQGDDDLADDLQGVVLALEAALKAEQTGRAERRGAKLAEARAALEQLAPGRPELRDMAAALGRM
jgi:Caspase domain